MQNGAGSGGEGRGMCSAKQITFKSQWSNGRIEEFAYSMSVKLRLQRQRSFACHVLMPPTPHVKTMTSGRIKVEVAAGKLLWNKRLLVSGERVQKKIWTKRWIYLHLSRGSIQSLPLGFSCTVSPEPGAQFWLLYSSKQPPQRPAPRAKTSFYQCFIPTAKFNDHSRTLSRVIELVVKLKQNAGETWKEL